MRAQQLAPERGSNLGLHRGDDHLTLTKAIEHLHQKVVGLGGQLADLDREHGRRATGDLGARIQGPHLRPHDLPAVAGLVEDVGQHRRVEMF